MRSKSAESIGSESRTNASVGWSISRKKIVVFAYCVSFAIGYETGEDIRVLDTVYLFLLLGKLDQGKQLKLDQMNQLNKGQLPLWVLPLWLVVDLNKPRLQWVSGKLHLKLLLELRTVGLKFLQLCYKGKILPE